MTQPSKIGWTHTTWNPITGCSKISHGCKYCYAERMAKRLHAQGMEKYRNGFKLTTHEHTLKDPLKWKKPKIVFVNSMSDLFHKDVPAKFIMSVFEVMNEASQHTFQVLTKRPERVVKANKHLHWTSNIWMGTSVESEKYLSRTEVLKQTDACVKFLSLEPLLAPFPNLNLSGIDWVIVGGESGPGARPMKEEWVTEIRDNCVESGVPFFFKQWGGVNKKKTGRALEGKQWVNSPTIRRSPYSLTLHPFLWHN